MPAFFRHLTVTEMAALFCGGFLVATWFGVFLYRTFAQKWIHGRRSANEMIGLTLAAFSTLYGILLGLLAVEAYQDFAAVKDIVSKEALTVAALHRDFEGYPQPIRGELQDKLRDYAREAIETLHPADGASAVEAAHKSSPNLKALFDRVMGFQPALKSHETILAESFSRLNLLVEHRRYLIVAGDDGIPPELWRVVCLGAFLLLGLMCLFDMELHVHLILSGAMALFLGSVVFLIAALDNPFSGGLTVSAAPLEAVLEMLTRER